MTDGDDPEAECKRLRDLLAREQAAHAATREQLATARRQARTWRRVAEWIHNARNVSGPHP